MALRLFHTGSVAVAAVLTVLACVQVWASLTVPFVGTVRRYGWEGDGIIVLVLGQLALAFALYTWVERRPSTFRLVTLFSAFLGGLIFVTALVNLLDSERAVGSAQSELGLNLKGFLGLDFQSFVDTGEGVYVAIAAGFLLAATSSAAFVIAHQQPGAFALASSDSGGCARCHAELPPTANFCPQCGANAR